MRHDAAGSWLRAHAGPGSARVINSADESITSPKFTSSDPARQSRISSLAISRFRALNTENWLNLQSCMMSKPQDSDNRKSTESQCRSADNVKIQALNLVNFRLRFADNLKIQVLNTGICMVRAVNFQYSVPES